jgi:HD superfamily phosphohydrolase YqeK
MTPTSEKESSIAVTRQMEGEYVAFRSFSDAEILEFLNRHTTLHKQVEVLYVVDGYEATVNWDDSPMVPPAKGLTYRDALVALMQGGDILSGSGR